MSTESRSGASSYPVQIGRGMLIALFLSVSAVLAIAVGPRLLGYQNLVVQGGSMGEAHPVGSLVLVGEMTPSEVEVGDVIVLEAEGQLPILHRVVSREENGGRVLVRTRGDANEHADAGTHSLPGRVVTPVLTLPYVGYFVHFLTKPVGWLLIIALPAAILAFSTLGRIWRQSDRKLARRRQITAS